MLKLERLEEKLNQVKSLLSHLDQELNSLEQEYSQALEVAQRDDLTGLLRRKGFDKKWQKLNHECQTHQEGCAILMIDIDKFKDINDQYGHAMGDEVIKRVSALLQKFESPNHCVGRFGGEEFIVGIRGTAQEVAVTAEFIRRGVESIPATKKFTVSIGIAHSKELGYETEKLISSADKALYAAKNAGRNRVKAAVS